MTVATLSSKGQITLPVAARRLLGLHAGDRIVLEAQDDRIVMRRAQDFLGWKGRLGPARTRDAERDAMRRAASRAVRKESA
jgi:antitoxin PrlF